MAYSDISTVLNNFTNQSTAPQTVGDLETLLSTIFQSTDASITADNKAEIEAIYNALKGSGLADGALVQTVAPGTTSLKAGGDTLYSVPGDSNVQLGASGSGVVHILLGPSSSLTATNKQEAGRALDAGHASTAAATHNRFNIIASSGDNSITLNKGASQATSTVGNDTIVSRGGRDTITGGSGHDTITAGGNSLVQAGTSGDTISGGLRASSHDTIMGGSGRDQIVVAHGNNLMIGEGGRTYMQAGDGLDTIQGGTGRETIWGSGSTLIQAGSRNLIHGQGSDTIQGGDGRNTIQSSTGSQLIQGGSGHLEINISKQANDTIFGGSQHDVVHINQSAADVVDITTSGRTQTLTFANGQTLTTQHVAIEFKDPHK